MLDVVLLHVCAVAQTLFTVLWSTRPFWSEWVGRALWFKAVVLTLIFDRAVFKHWTEPPPPQREDDSAWWLLLLTAAIVVQLVTLVYEMWRGARRSPEA